MKRSRTSAGLLLFRKKGGRLEVLLAHPGGPYFQNKDDGIWTVPKGEVGEDEDLLKRARIEFEEELGVAPAPGELIELGWIKQKGGKTVYAWAFEGDLPENFKVSSNTFEMEWPPHSGKMESFPEVDRAAFFSIGAARIKMKPTQEAFLDRLIAALNSRASG
jgi:predicted NUDIX family NTP pyrophosphohydrolase